MTEKSGELLGINEVATELGVTHRTLRFYEDQGLIEPQRAGSTRIYSRREVARMRLILRGKSLGFSIREIREFLALYNADSEHAEQSEHLLERIRTRMDSLNRQRAALDQTIDELRAIEREALAHLARLGKSRPGNKNGS